MDSNQRPPRCQDSCKTLENRCLPWLFDVFSTKTPLQILASISLNCKAFLYYGVCRSVEVCKKPTWRSGNQNIVGLRTAFVTLPEPRFANGSGWKAPRSSWGTHRPTSRKSTRNGICRRPLRSCAKSGDKEMTFAHTANGLE